MDLHSVLSACETAGLSLPQRYQLTADNRPLRLRLGDISARTTDHTLLVHQVSGHWAINQPLLMHIDCVAASSTLPLSSLTGQTVAIDQVTDRGELFSLCGIVTGATAGQSDGALTHYRLTVEDSLSLLRLRRNSRIFSDATIPEISQILLAEWAERNPLFQASLGLDTERLQMASPRLAFTFQQDETDFDFLTRLWAGAGINWWIEPVQHSPQPRQLLVLADREGEAAAMDTGALRYHRAGATEQRDSVTAFSGHRQIQPGQVSYQQWQPADSHSPGTSSQTARELPPQASLAEHLFLTPAHPEDEPWADLRASQHALARQLAEKSFYGTSTVRHLHVGRWFRLDDHPELDASHTADEREFTLLSTTFVARNNLPKTLNRQIQALYSPALPAGLTLDDTRGERIKNRFRAVRRSIALVPEPPLAPPLATPMTGVVVGPAGEQVHVDALYRIQVRFPQLQPADHAHQGGRGTSNSEGDSAWIPVLTPLAGPQFGNRFIPRVGQTVQVDFLNGDPDRPFVQGVLYDGTHAPARFSHTGSLPDNRYLSGIVSNEIQGSRTSQLKFDDTPAEISAQLQSDEQASQLNLGDIRHPRNATAQNRGMGFELRTDGQGAVRTAGGLLLSAHAQPQAAAGQMDVEAVQGQLRTRQTATEAMNDTARQQQATQQAIAGRLKDYIDQLENRLGRDQVNAFKQALLVLASPDGVSVDSGKDLHVHASEHAGIGAGGHMEYSTPKDLVAHTGRKLALFAAQGGLKLFAGKGPVAIQAQADTLEAVARKAVRVVSTEAAVDLTAKQEIVLNAGGSQLKINASGVFVKTGGVFEVKNAQHKVMGGESVNASLPALPVSGTSAGFVELNYVYENLSAVQGAPYTLLFDNGTVRKGKLDKQGYAKVDGVPLGQPFKVFYGEDERTQPEPFIPSMTNPIFGQQPTSPEHARQLLDDFSKAHMAYLQDHYFDDEIAEMFEDDFFDHEDLDDYLLENEEPSQTLSYQALHQSSAEADQEEQFETYSSEKGV